jgi:hypothetical protein
MAIANDRGESQSHNSDIESPWEDVTCEGPGAWGEK